MGVIPAQTVPSLTGGSQQWARSSDHSRWPPSGHWTRQDPSSIWAACSGVTGHGARDRTGDGATYSMGAERASWSGQLTQGCDWSESPGTALYKLTH